MKWIFLFKKVCSCIQERIKSSQVVDNIVKKFSSFYNFSKSFIKSVLGGALQDLFDMVNWSMKIFAHPYPSIVKQSSPYPYFHPCQKLDQKKCLILIELKQMSNFNYFYVNYV